MLKINNYEVSVISDAIVTKIDDDIELVAIMAPTTDFIGSEIDVLSDFLENDGKLYGLVVPDFETCEKEGISREQLEEIMQENLKNLNSQVAAYERLVSISIYPSEFEKTPKKSIKRYLYNVAKLGIQQ